MPVQGPVYICPHCKSRIPFGTENDPPPRKCPGCQHRLFIPTALGRNSFIELNCPTCSTKFNVVVLRSGHRRDHFKCPKCGSTVNPPTEPPSAAT